MSPQVTEEPEAPSEPHTITNWLKVNLALLTFAVGIASWTGGALVTGTMRISDASHRLTDLEDRAKKTTTKQDEFHTGMVDVDRRLNEGKAYVDELRRQRDGQVATLEQRIAVLEAQMRFFADRTTAPPIGIRR